jgi:hypothetical protein
MARSNRACPGCRTSSAGPHRAAGASPTELTGRHREIGDGVSLLLAVPHATWPSASCGWLGGRIAAALRYRHCPSPSVCPSGCSGLGAVGRRGRKWSRWLACHDRLTCGSVVTGEFGLGRRDWGSRVSIGTRSRPAAWTGLNSLEPVGAGSAGPDAGHAEHQVEHAADQDAETRPCDDVQWEVRTEVCTR